MNKKGFTVVELLAVISIIVIIVLIVVPNVISIAFKHKVSGYIANVKNIEDAVDAYILEYDIVLDSNNKATINLNDLYDRGLIDKNLKDSRCDKLFSGENTIITISQEEDVYAYDVRVVTECEIKSPIINAVNVLTEGNSITINVDSDPTDGNITTFYYSYDNGYNYVRSNKSSHRFSGLAPSTNYKIKVKVDDSNGSYAISTGQKVITDAGVKLINNKLENGLIPIYYDDSINNWVVADEDDAWYDYNNKKWSNAISVTESSRSTYLPGKELVEDDVLGYFVYIPRYKYKLFNTGTGTVSKQAINIVFENTSTPKSMGINSGEWLTHPAFTFGDKELEGIWVGKFELTGTLGNPTIKPNIYSIVDKTIYDFFNSSKLFSSNKIKYGIDNKSNSHVMKNTEWGAMAYLSHSIYGANDNIRINNNQNFKTGCGASAPPINSHPNYEGVTRDCQIPYGEANQIQSTTGNIYGIYDVVGGAWEYVMGVSKKYNNISKSKLDLDSIHNDYYNNYETSSSGQFSKRILGDAMSETRNWYSNLLQFGDNLEPWIARGGAYSDGKYVNQFASIDYYGSWRNIIGTRIVLF